MARRVSKKEQAAAKAVAAKDKIKNATAHLRRNKKRPTMASYRKSLSTLSGPLGIAARTIGASSALKRQQEDWDRANKAVKGHKSAPKATELPDQGRIGTVQEEDARPKGSKNAPKALNIASNPDVGGAPEAGFGNTTLGRLARMAKDVKGSRWSKDGGRMPDAPEGKRVAKGAPSLPKNWRSLPTSHPDRVAFRSWYKKNRPSAPKTAVAKAVVTKKAAPKTAAPARTADLTGLQARIKMKRKSGQAIPAAWLKAEKTAKAKARAAKVAQSSKRIPSSIDRQENQKEAARGRSDMAGWKSGVASAKAKRLEAGQRKVADAKAQAVAHNQKARAIKASKSRIAETKAKKADAQGRLAKMKADLLAEKKNKMQSKMSALPGFRGQ